MDDGQIDSPCILDNSVPSGSLWGHCPAYLTAAIRKYQSRARVPMTISCLWVTGFFLSGVYFLLPPKFGISFHVLTREVVVIFPFSRVLQSDLFAA